MKAYTTSSNCTRAAIAALGKGAKKGSHFTIERRGAKDYVFHAVGKRPRATSAKDDPTKVLTQPMMQRFLAAMTGHPVTVRQLMKKEDCVNHTVRGAISRLRTAGCDIRSTREGRVVSYRYYPNSKANAPEAKAAASHQTTAEHAVA